MFEALETNGKHRSEVCKVIQGGPLKSKKGVNFLILKFLSCFNKKDIKDAIFAIEQEVDWIALSFVRTPRFRRIARFNCKTF
jgi:pyruvate kinase